MDEVVRGLLPEEVEGVQGDVEAAEQLVVPHLNVADSNLAGMVREECIQDFLLLLFWLLVSKVPGGLSVARRHVMEITKRRLAHRLDVDALIKVSKQPC